MSDLQTDEEKAEALKAWWKDNGTSVVTGVVLAVAALFGWEYWKKSEIETAETAASLYRQSLAVADEATATQHVLDLRNKYASTPYAALASLDSAKNFAEAGEYESAAESLRWVLNNSKDADLKNVASVRLARVLLIQGKHDDALQLANQKYGAAYESLIEEIKGDVYLAQNKPDEARKAYERALSANKSGSSELIKLKLDNLGQGA